MTINCAERGLLLLRVRNEILITISAYQTLYESSVPFGFRKVMVDLQTKEALEKKVRMMNYVCYEIFAFFVVAV